MIRTIAPIFSIVIALTIFFFFSKPMFADIKVLQDEATQFEVAAAKAVELNETLAKLINTKRSYNVADTDRLEALVPSKVNEVKILTDLNEIARSHNMLFGNVEVDGEGGGKGDTKRNENSNSRGTSVAFTDFTQSEITFSLIGTYEQFKAFLADVEKSLVMLEVTNILFEAGEGNLQQYTVGVQVFALSPKE